MKAGQNARDDPFITLTFCAKSGEPTQKPVDLVFTQQHGEQRDRECNEWVRKCIEHIVLARKERGSANKRAQKTETGMRPLVRRWVAPEMIRPHTSGDAPPPEPEDFIIAPELLEAEPETGGWDEFSGTTSEDGGDDTIVPQPEEYPQADEPSDESAEVFFLHEESPIEHAPASKPLPDPIPTQLEDEPAPDVPESASLKTDAHPTYPSGADSTQSPEPELVPETEIPEVAPDTQPEIPEKVPSSFVPAEQVSVAEPDTAAVPDEGKFTSVLKKLAIASGWTPAAEHEQIPAFESTSAAESSPDEISQADEISPAADEDVLDDHLHIPDNLSPPTETHNTGEQQTPMPDTPDTVKPDNEPVRSDATPETVVPLEFPNEPTPIIPEILAPDDRRDGPTIDEPSLPRKPEDILPAGQGTPARSELPEPLRRRFTFPTGVALIFVALLLIAVTAILLTTPLMPGGVTVNEPPVIVTPSPAPITTITTPVTIPLTGTWVRVTYNGTFVGSIGNPYSLQPISGTGDQIYSSQTIGDIIQVSVQKQDYYGDMLNVQIYTNGTAIAQQSTRVPHGAIDLLIDTRTGNPPGVTVHTEIKS